jgi:hypothetical protein
MPDGEIELYLMQDSGEAGRRSEGDSARATAKISVPYSPEYGRPGC